MENPQGKCNSHTHTHAHSLTPPWCAGCIAATKQAIKNLLRTTPVLGLLLVLLSFIGSALTFAAAQPPLTIDQDSQPFTLGFWIGGGLLMVGLIGVPLFIFFGHRRQLLTERDDLHDQVTALKNHQWELEAEIDRYKQAAERQQRQLQAEVSIQQANVNSIRTDDQRFRMLTQQLPVGIFMTDLKGECHYVNEAWCQSAGLTIDQAAGLAWIQTVHPDDRDQVWKLWRQAVETTGEFISNYRVRSPSGRVLWMGGRAVPLRDRIGRINYYLGTSTDIADLKKTEETLRASEARFRSYFELPLVGIGLSGPDKRWWEVNDRLCDMLGYRRSQLLRLSWPELTYREDLTAEMEQFDRMMNRWSEGYSLDKRFVRQDGNVLYVSVSTRCVRRSNGGVDHFVTVVQDITERKQAEAHIQHLSHYDALTGLPNRMLMGDRLEQALLRSARDHGQVGILVIGLDHFKRINDTLGHTAGDQLLQETAERLKKCIRECDTLSRQGGDEFAILLPDLGSNDETGRIAQRVLDAVAEPYKPAGQEVHIGCSIGISLYPRDGRTPEILLKNADSALYRAKDIGRNNYQYYLSGATVLARERLNLENSLRYAVERQQLELYYQAKWDFHTNRIAGAEALIRWNHPELGLVSPARFIPIAEDSGLVLPIGEWVLRTAVREIGDLHQNGWPGFRVAVNLSTRQFRQDNLTEWVRSVLLDTGFDPSCLELELTESILMNHTEGNLTALKDFKAMKVRLAIDDFGTGYSSLGYLQRFPMDVLKIDRSFVTDLPGNLSNVAIVDAIVTLAHGLGLEVVAEGVETVEHMEFLRAHGCDEGQGYYFSRPVPLGEFKALLLKDRERVAAQEAASTPPVAPS